MKVDFGKMKYFIYIIKERFGQSGFVIFYKDGILQ